MSRNINNSSMLPMSSLQNEVKKVNRRSMMACTDSKKKDMKQAPLIKRRRGRPPKKMPIDTHTMVISPQLCKASSSEDVHYGSFESTPINFPDTKVTPVASNATHNKKTIDTTLEQATAYDRSSCSPANATIQQSPDVLSDNVNSVYHSNNGTPAITTPSCMWNTNFSSINSQVWDYTSRLDGSIPEHSNYGTEISMNRSSDTSTSMHYESGDLKYVSKVYPTDMIPDYGNSNNPQYWGEDFSNVDFAAANFMASSDTVSPLSVSTSSSEYESVDAGYLNFCESYDTATMFGQTEDLLQKKQLTASSPTQLWLV